MIYIGPLHLKWYPSKLVSINSPTFDIYMANKLVSIVRNKVEYLRSRSDILSDDMSRNKVRNTEANNLRIGYLDILNHISLVDNLISVGSRKDTLIFRSQEYGTTKFRQYPLLRVTLSNINRNMQTYYSGWCKENETRKL